MKGLNADYQVPKADGRTVWPTEIQKAVQLTSGPGCLE